MLKRGRDPEGGTQARRVTFVEVLFKNERGRIREFSQEDLVVVVVVSIPSLLARRH